MKTINVKRIITFFSIVNLFTNLSAQKITDTATLRKGFDSYSKRATYIFEGKIDSSKYFTIKTGEYTYDNFMAYLVEVDSVIKGNLQKGTVEILQPANGIIEKGPDGIGSSLSSEKVDGPPAKGTYLCFDKATNMTSSYYKNSNGKTLRFYDGRPKK